MSVSGMLGVGLASLREQVRRTEASAARVARGTAPEGTGVEGADLAGEAVEQLEARASARAAGAIIRTADEMLGTLIDRIA